MTGTVDIRTLSREERRGLLAGPKVTLTRGGSFFAEVHKRAFMATSMWANGRIQARGTISVLELPPSASRADTQALKIVIGWLSSLGGDNIRPIPMGANTVEACKIYHAATALGMRLHVSHIAAYFHSYIEDHSTIPTYEELDAMQAAFHPDTKVYKHLVKDLAHRRHKKQIPDMKDFEAYLKKQPTLARALDEIDAKYIADRKAAKEAVKAHLRERRADERRADEKEEQRRREEFEAGLKAARGGRAGGYGMGV
ncbi:hypothetical protein P171DRAFT_351741 [Karstenula rhodostoma CBS 690.94]|uniref:Uncharacterized protein n=1 Tax=Karstenula rhodostoma CBS 690.94 TaxID=1392251 RepID=A0A9P4UGX0_9PLEO|nr:hypothetical protein P171DRAFT_351741 [Karstenula rhodostoma CBS 690.94]